MQYVSRVTHHVLRLAVLMGLLASLTAPAAAQDAITFTASVDRTSISSDQFLTLQLTLSGAFQGAGNPQFPPLTGFAIVGSSSSSQISIVNGKVSSQMVFTYRLQPTTTGTVTIPAISIQAGGQTYQTQPVTVNVTQGAAPPAQQPPAQSPPNATAPSTLAGQSLYVEADVDNPRPWVGQQIIYRFRLYQAVNLFNQPQLGWPDWAGFLTYDLSPNNQYYQNAGGKRYLVTEVRRALFPTAPGQVKIGQATLTIPGDFFNNTVRLQTQPVSVDVQALPPGAPAGFAGAVGQFAIEAQVQPTQTRANEPVTLLVRVSGKGNVTILADPAGDIANTLNGWRVYDPQVKTDVKQEGDVIQGEKRFERPLVPKSDGELTIPAFRLVYFDPTLNQYSQIETKPIVVRVAPGEAPVPGPVVIGEDKKIVVLASDIRHIKPAPPALTVGQASLLTRPLYWTGWGLGLAAWAGVWVWNRRRRHLETNVAYARALRARAWANKCLNKAHKLARTDQDAAYAAVSQALNDYVGDKLNRAAAGLTRDLVRQTLTARSIPAEAIERLLACLDWADSGRFAPVAAGRSAEELVKEAESVVAELEQVMGVSSQKAGAAPTPPIAGRGSPACCPRNIEKILMGQDQD